MQRRMDRMRMGLLVTTLLAAGCGPVPQLPGATKSSSTAALPAPATKPGGWPVGTDPALSLEALAAFVHGQVDAYVDMHESDYYPKGWSKMRRVVRDHKVELVDEGGKPTGVIRVTYVKHFSRMHKTREAASQETELLPASPGPTFESMKSPKNVKSEPIELAVKYVVEGDQWHRTESSINPPFKEGRSLAEQLQLP